MDLFVSGVIEVVQCAGSPSLVAPFGGCIWTIVGALPGVGSTIGIGTFSVYLPNETRFMPIALFMSINVANSFGTSIPAS